MNHPMFVKRRKALRDFMKRMEARQDSFAKRPVSTPKHKIPLTSKWAPSMVPADDTSWAEFVKKETEASKQPEAYLVKPSGYRDAQLHLVLHYPTFRVANDEYGEMDDASNPTIKQLRDKGIRPDPQLSLGMSDLSRMTRTCSGSRQRTET